MKTSISLSRCQVTASLVVWRLLLADVVPAFDCACCLAALTHANVSDTDSHLVSVTLGTPQMPRNILCIGGKVRHIEDGRRTRLGWLFVSIFYFFFVLS